MLPSVGLQESEGLVLIIAELLLGPLPGLVQSKETPELIHLLDCPTLR